MSYAKHKKAENTTLEKLIVSSNEISNDSYLNLFHAMYGKFYQDGFSQYHPFAALIIVRDTIFMCLVDFPYPGNFFFNCIPEITKIPAPGLYTNKL